MVPLEGLGAGVDVGGGGLWAEAEADDAAGAVSYTHLTLPTKA